MIHECYDSFIDLGRLAGIESLQGGVNSLTVKPNGFRLHLDGLAKPYEISVNDHNPGQVARVQMARTHLERAWPAARAMAGLHQSPGADASHMWQGQCLQLSDIVVIERIQRIEKPSYGKTRGRGVTLHVTLRYAVHTTDAVHVHATGDFDPERSIATTGGMDFEHGKLLAAWLAYHAGGKRWAA